METLKHLLTYSFDGAPVWGWLVGFALLHLEWWLARTKKVGAGSTLELIPDLLFKLGGRFVPGLRTVLAVLGSTKRLSGANAPEPVGEDTPTDPAKPEPPSLPPAAILLFGAFAFGATGCAEVMYRYDQGTATAALASMSCKDTLSKANTQQVNACGQLLKAGASDRTSIDPEAKLKAQACLDAWRLTYDKIDAGCAAVKAAAQSAKITRPIIEAGVNKNKQALEWIAKLAKVVADVAALFSSAGIQFSEVL